MLGMIRLHKAFGTLPPHRIWVNVEAVDFIEDISEMPNRGNLFLCLRSKEGLYVQETELEYLNLLQAINGDEPLTQEDLEKEGLHTNQELRTGLCGLPNPNSPGMTCNRFLGHPYSKNRNHGYAGTFW